jgi:NADPH-dependent 2,4-dienoyl-CoA reductase/sulfur reductase-like enzyme
MGSAGLIVVGASLAGLRAVEAARKSGYRGPITLIGDEPHAPYDRPPLSKAFLAADESLDPTFRSVPQLAEAGVDLRLGQPASAVDTENKRVAVGDEWLDYSGLIIATGASARRLPDLPSLAGIHHLRTRDDAAAIRSALLSSENVVVVGAGFIGSEVASSARALGRRVTIVEAADTPLVRAVGPELGASLSRLHEANGTQLRCGASIVKVGGADRVEFVELADGTVLPADVLVVGIGSVPNTGWLDGSGLQLADGVVCDEYLHAGAEGVYAAGDVARWPNPAFPELASMRLEHWTSAAEQGAHAVRNWLAPDRGTPFRTVPYFWSDWYGDRIQFVGATAIEEVRFVEGGPGDAAFLALCRSGHRLTGALAVNRPAAIMKYRGLIAKDASWDEALAFAGQGLAATAS